MASIYMEEYKGFLYDVPNMDFIRCDGKPYHYDKVSTSDATFSAETTPINGGQGKLPIGWIETGATQEVTLASAEFDLEMFEMANAAKMTTGDYNTVEADLFAVAAGPQITLPFEVQTGSVKIRGMEEATTAAAGKFAVAITAATAQADGSTVITFADNDVAVGDDIRVWYKRRVVDGAKVTVKTTSTTAKGELYLHYPISSSGEDCTESSLIAWLHLYMPKVRVTALPGFSASYKTAQTPTLTFSAMDPHRSDKKSYEMVYEKLDEDGNVVAKSGETVDWT